MATKSFTNELKFNSKSVDSLLKALDNDTKAKVVDVKFSIVSNSEDIKKNFCKEVKCNIK